MQYLAQLSSTTKEIITGFIDIENIYDFVVAEQAVTL
jgi:hypothetical protein